MSIQGDFSRLSVAQFAERFQGDVVPLTNVFSYFFAAVSLSEEDLKEYLEEPIAALPPAIAAALPPTCLLLVPYLERANGREKGDRAGQDHVCLEKPAESRNAPASVLATPARAVLVLAVKDQEVADYHYWLYQSIARIMGDRWNEESQSRFFSLLREELAGGIHGEVDEAGWRLKQVLLRRQSNVRRETKGFREYARQSFIDTLTLYLHGLCCDIDVETGPRQLPSRYLRKRLELMQSLYPPPSGYAVFPEGLNEESK